MISSFATHWFYTSPGESLKFVAVSHNVYTYNSGQDLQFISIGCHGKSGSS